jgi:hypothetical protein
LLNADHAGIGYCEVSGLGKELDCPGGWAWDFAKRQMHA